MEVLTGVGLILGPITSTAIYQYFSYFWCFFSIGMFFVFLGILFFFCFAEVPCLSEGDDDANEVAGESVCTILSEPKCVMAALTNTVCETQIFFLPILAPYLTTEFGFTPVQVGNFFLIYPLWPVFSVSLPTLFPSRSNVEPS